MKLKAALVLALVLLLLGAWSLRSPLAPSGMNLDVAAANDTRSPDLDENQGGPDAEGPERRDLTVDVKEAADRGLPSAAGEGALEAAAPEGGSITVTVLWRDRSPASDVSLLLKSRDKVRFRQSDLWRTTDEDGRVSFDGLKPGKYVVEADRGGEFAVDLEEGAAESKELVLDGPIDVSGRVISESGGAVAGAEIVAVTTRSDWRGSRRVALADSTGRFTIRCVSDNHSLGAFASGWAPSKLFDLSDVDASALGDDHVLEVELVLKKRGGDVWGTVVDPSGAPVAGVVVAAGKAGFYDEYKRPGHFTETPKPHVVITDAEGRYRIDGIAAGPQPLEAWHPDWAIWRTELDVAEGSQMRQDVVLDAGVIVSGTVYKASGEPAPGATILCLAEPFVDPFPDQGPTESGSPFAHPRTRADESGRYALGPLTAGDLHLYASLGASMFTPYDERGSSYEGTLQESLRGAPGQTLEWNPKLTMGLTLGGTVRYADGSPMGHVFVTAMDSAAQNFAVTTNKEGAFTMTGLSKVPYRVSVQMPFGAPDSASIGAIYDVVPPASGLEFQSDYVPVPKPAKGTLRFRLSDAASVGEQLGKAAVIPIVYNIDSPSWQTLEASVTGAYETEHSPGRYRVFLRVKDD
ncbi:MAG: carboxypeptidase regulatory-like domain-containing protein, partial [Planctomycetota bacterium]